MRIELNGRIDSNNAPEIEKTVMEQLEGQDGAPVELDASGLEYISSAGLRVLLRVRKSHPDMTISGVNSEVYEILDMTGFTEMMTVKKAYRVVSVDGCEVIGEGQNGKVYRIDRDNVVKTYKNADALAEIQHEREVARLALVLGIPTAISYDVVRVGDSYGSVFELLDSRAFAKILAEEPERMDWCVREYVDMLKKIHGTVVPAGKLPRIKDTVMAWVGGVKPLLPEKYGEQLERMIADIPECDTMLHGDYHTKNIVLAGDEVLLIDMDTLSVGHPIFELAQMYNCYIGFGEYDPAVVAQFQGYSAATARKFWKQTLRAYLGTDDEEVITDAENKIRCVAYTRLIDWNRRHKNPGTEADRATAALWTRELLGLLERVDTLVF